MNTDSYRTLFASPREDLAVDNWPVDQSELNVSLAGKTLEAIERQAILDTLRACRGNKARSARMLGISEKSIYNKMRRLGLPLSVSF